MFFTDDAVVRIGLADRRAHEQLDLAVAIRDEVLMALALDGQLLDFAEEAHAELAGTAGEVNREGKSGLGRIRHIHPPPSPPRGGFLYRRSQRGNRLAGFSNSAL